MTRTLPTRLLVAVALLGSVLALATPGLGAQEPPPEGATDGWPVGAEDVERGATTTPVSLAPAATPPARYFGRGAYAAIVNAARSTSMSCSISQHGRVALMLAPVFKESSNATTPSTAPSPMTLSRYDEWSGTFGTTNNRDANYGLYAFRNPSTTYPRAYWHPGIGIWQYDSAGVGSPFTASERMDAGVVGGDVARIVTGRYCAAKASGKTDQQARFAAWADWGSPCNLCEQAFNELMLNKTSSEPSGTNSGFQYLQLVDGIDALGGTQRRTCSINGGGNIPCWYVNPANAQGASWWTGNPNDGNPTSGMAPLSHPFYVFKSGGQEHRHWLSQDTGYPVHISARRTLDHNARPRSGDTDSGLRWASESGLCDKTAGRGLCDPLPPSGVRVRFSTVNGTNYRPLIGDFDGDGLSDVFWYAPGATQDYVWWSTSNGGFSSTPVSVGGDYRPHVGDVDGNGTDDIVWYGSSSSYVWRGSTARRFASSPVSIPWNRQLVLADLDGNRSKDIVVYGPGTLSDHTIVWRNGFSYRSITVNGHYRPVSGDFDRNGADDIIWYAAGPAADYVWWTSPGGSRSQTQVTVNGTYQPLVGDFDGNAVDDVMWYGVGDTPDYTWFGNTTRAFSSWPTPVGGAYIPIIADLAGDGRDDIVWYAPGTATDYWWRYSATRRYSSSVLSLNGSFVPGAGIFGSGRDGIFWYGPGAEADALWFA